MPENELILPELDALTDIVEQLKETKDIFEDIEEKFPTAKIIEKQIKESKKFLPVPQNQLMTTEIPQDIGMDKLDKLIKVDEELLQVTSEDVIGSINELSQVFKDGIPANQPVGLLPAPNGELDDPLMKMLESIKSIKKGDTFTEQPEFLDFIEEQEASSKELLKGTEQEREIGLEMLDALTQLRKENKTSLNSLLEQRKKEDKKKFTDVGKDIASSFKDIGFADIIEGALIAGLAGWEIGTVIETWLNDNWQIRDKFAAAMDTIVETFPEASEWLGLINTKLDLGKQVFTPEERAKNLRVQSRIELQKEKESQLERVKQRGDLGEAARAQIIQKLESDIQKLSNETSKLFQIGSDIVIEDSAEVLQKMKELGKRQREANELTNPIMMEKALDNKANKTFRQDILKQREPIKVEPKTTIIPVPPATPPAPSPQKQVDDFGVPMMHMFWQ